MRSWMRWFKGQSKDNTQPQLNWARRSSAGRLGDRRRRPALEALEDRLAPAFDLTISTAPTAGMTLFQGVLTATNTGANVNVFDIRDALLAGNDVFISNGALGVETGNITWVANANLNYNGAFARSLVITTDPSGPNAVVTLNSQVNTTSTLNQFYGAQDDLIVNNAINAGGGTVVLVSLDGEVRGTGSITAANLSVTAFDDITLDQNNDVTTGVFAAEVTGAGNGVVFHDINDLTIGSVGTTNPVEGVITNNGSILITTGVGGLRVTEDVDAGAADIALRAGGDESIFRNDVLITNSGGHQINIAANRMILDGNPGTNAITAVGGGRVILRAATANRPITLSPTDPPNVLVISDDEIDSVTTTGVLQIGNGIEGDVTVNTAINPDNVDTLTITTAGAISGGGSIAVTNLRLSAGNAVNLTGANDVDVLAGEVNNAGQPFTFNGVGPLTVGAVDGVVGVSTTNAPIVITTSTGSLTVDDAIDSGLGNIVLTAGAANSANPADVLTINANVTAVSGNHITLGGNDLVVNAATVSTTGAGNIVMSFGAPGPLPAAGTAVFNNGALISVVNGNIDLTAAFSVTLNGSARLQATAGGGINITTDDITIGPSASISASDGVANGNNVVTIRNFSAGRAISLGANANLGLTGAELDRVQAELLRLGRNDGSATGNISLAGQVNLLTVTTLHLVTAGAVVDATATEIPDLLVSALAIQARTGIGSADDLDIAVNTVAALNTGGASSGDIQLSNTGALTIGIVAGVAGVQRTLGSLANIVVAATTTLTVNAPVNNTTGGNVDLTGATSITINGTVQTTGVTGDIQLTADDVIIAGAALVTTNDTATIRNATAGRAINLGTNTTLGLTDAELDRIDANVLVIGRNDATAAGTVTVSAPINLTVGVNVIPVLHIVTGGAVAQAGTGLLTVASLALEAAAGIGTLLATATATLAASGGTGGVSISNLGTLVIDTVDGVTGVTATGGNITVINTGGDRAGAFTVAANVQTPGNITLLAQEAVPASPGDNLAVDAGVTINSSAGDVILGAGDALTLPVGAVVQAAGTVTLTGGFGDNGHGGSVLFLGTATGAAVTVSGGNGDDLLIINPTSTIAAVAVQGLAGSDTIAVTPKAATTFNVVGGLPTPPALPGDILDVELAGTTDPTLTATSTPTGLQGSYTFGNRAPVNFQEIETLTSTADVAVTMTDAPDPVLAGGNITYTITVRNLGELNAQNVALLDAIPANTTFVSFTQTSGPAFTLTTPAVGGTGNVTATIGTFDGGAAATFTLVVKTDDALANHTVITNTATVTTDTAETTTNNTATATTRIGPVGFFAVGAAQGQRPRVAVYSRAGALVANFLAYAGTFRGGVRVAVGDVNGDGTADIITAAGPGSRQLVQVVDGTQLAALGGGRVPASALLRSFFVTSANFKGGVFVASGDVNADGADDIVVGMGAGAPRVLVFDGDTGAALANFKAYANTFKSGVTVAAGDVNGDLHADIIVAPQRGAQRVIVADGTALPVGGGRIANASLLGSFFPLQPNFTGGFFVAAGDVNGDLRADIIVAPASGAAPFVKVVDATRLHQVAPNGRLRGTALLANQLVFSQSFRGGVQVGAHELDLDGMAEVLVGFGPNKRTLKAFDVISRAFELNRRVPFDAGSLGGI